MESYCINCKKDINEPLEMRIYKNKNDFLDDEYFKKEMACPDCMDSQIAKAQEENEGCYIHVQSLKTFNQIVIRPKEEANG